MKTILYAAFCGTGKSYLCNNSKISCLELECWKYDQDNFPNNYIKDIKEQIGKVDYIFISTNPIVLKGLYNQGIQVNLIYPKKELKDEYFNRYFNRGSSIDFITTLDECWHNWLTELEQQSYCKHIVLESMEYLEDVIEL